MRPQDLILPIIFTTIIGLCLALQTAMNSQLRQYLYHPLQAGLISFLIGTLCLLILVYSQPALRLQLSQLSHVPWWLWLGGCLGVYCISMSIYTAPKLGFLTFTGLVLFGQLVMSMLLDHFGWLGVEKAPIQWQRLLGTVLIACGVVLTLQR